jgi:hypothetical protein
MMTPMPLDQYGVAIGTLVSFTRDPQHRFGSWYHGHVTIDVGAGVRWESALDVDAPSSVGVAYRLVEGLTTADLGPVAALAPGFHALAATPASGALDALDPHLRAASRIYVFGERFDSGDGVHDVHLNQGDPLGSQWWDSNGIWQDGAVACQGPDGHVAVWQVMFKTQRLTTDAHGHPLDAA